jgi:hypothetical protein
MMQDPARILDQTLPGSGAVELRGTKFMYSICTLDKLKKYKNALPS